MSATAEDSDFKFGIKLGFAKAHHKIEPRKKHGRRPGVGELPKILGFPVNISAMAIASDFKFSKPLGFAKSHKKITPRRKCGRSSGLRELPNIRGFLLIFL